MITKFQLHNVYVRSSFVSIETSAFSGFLALKSTEFCTKKVLLNGDVEENQGRGWGGNGVFIPIH